MVSSAPFVFKFDNLPIYGQNIKIFWKNIFCWFSSFHKRARNRISTGAERTVLDDGTKKSSSLLYIREFFGQAAFFGKIYLAFVGGLRLCDHEAYTYKCFSNRLLIGSIRFLWLNTIYIEV